LTLQEIEDGTLLTLVHSNVPEGRTSYELGAWQEYNFGPMKECLANRREGGSEGSEQAAPLKRPAHDGDNFVQGEIWMLGDQFEKPSRMPPL
jgi:hypothetical protein